MTSWAPDEAYRSALQVELDMCRRAGRDDRVTAIEAELERVDELLNGKRKTTRKRAT